VTRKHYDWSNGPVLLEPHSVAKHTILRSYLAAYFATLVRSPHQDVMRMTLVDGFAGGGLYFHTDTRELLPGSPIICLQAVQQAERLANLGRRKPLKLDVEYFFVESNPHAFHHLENVLRSSESASMAPRDIVHCLHRKFEHVADDIIRSIKNRNPRNGRSIFILDQYGYKETPLSVISKIFRDLPKAEIILTFAVDALLNFVSDGPATDALLNHMGTPDVLRGRTIRSIKDSESEWRLFIQSMLYRDLVAKSGAKHYTPFFVRNSDGHGDYWLLHLSQHEKARDVMTEVHWTTNNSFIHYGGPGLEMFRLLGYDPRRDARVTSQNSLGFTFDDDARKASIAALVVQIPSLLSDRVDGIDFGTLFSQTCNDSPATMSIYRLALEELISLRAVNIRGADGAARRSARQLKSTDRLILPSQRSFLLPGR
jgi:three-Cys-motif partner protein